MKTVDAGLIGYIRCMLNLHDWGKWSETQFAAIIEFGKGEVEASVQKRYCNRCNCCQKRIV